MVCVFWIKLDDTPMKIITEYKLHNKVTAGGYAFIDVRKGMYR